MNDDRLETFGPCPHCGAPILMDPVLAASERAYCGGCGLRTPAFPRYGSATRGALEFLKTIGAPAGESLVTAARRAVNAYDRRDVDALERAVEELRSRLPGRRISEDPPGTPGR